MSSICQKNHMLSPPFSSDPSWCLKVPFLLLIGCVRKLFRKNRIVWNREFYQIVNLLQKLFEPKLCWFLTCKELKLNFMPHFESVWIECPSFSDSYTIELFWHPWKESPTWFLFHEREKFRVRRLKTCFCP